MKSKTTWIVIADGMHARVLRQDKHGAPLVPALDRELYEPAVHGFSRDLKSDAPGRAFDSGSVARHAMEPRTDPKTHEKKLFALRVADLINTAAAQETFDQLVLVAPPKTLGELRAHLDAHARKLVIGEISRDLIKTPPPSCPPISPTCLLTHSCAGFGSMPAHIALRMESRLTYLNATIGEPTILSA